MSFPVLPFRRRIPRRTSHAIALILFAVVTPSAPAGAAGLFSAVFLPGTDGHALWATSDWANFASQWDSWASSGLRMDDFEVLVERDRPFYIGSFRAGTDAHAAWIVTDWDDFTAKWAEFERSGLRMHDFETYVVRGVRWYAGIFRAGTGGRAAHIVTDWDNFTDTWKGFEAEGLRMHDFETWLDGRTRWYAGIFRPGSGGRAAWFTQDWDDFVSKWGEFENAGLRLVDFEFYDDGAQRTFGGIFRPGSGGRYAWLGVDWQNFTTFWHERAKEGYRIVDIEVEPAACSDVCLNQLILPPPDYYNYGITRTATHCPGLPGTCAVPGNNVVYRAPFYEEDGARWVRLSAVLIDDAIFTLPFTDTDIKHNGWLYSPGSWHHAIDYYNGKAFNVRAAAPGTVVHVGWDWWSGNTVIVSHDAGGEKDVYRTIYMHLLNGAENDCAVTWSQTVPNLTGSDLQTFQSYLSNTNCNQNGAGTPDSTRWGTNSDVISVSPGDFVQRGQILGKAGSTGPGGCGCMGGGTGPNHHLHIFFAHRDPTDDRWYFFDPYGIYGPTECYPTRDDAEGASAATPCARYPSAWLGGRPQLPPPPAVRRFRRADANLDAAVNIADVQYLLNFLFLGGPRPPCGDATDVNDDGQANIADAQYLLNFLFLGGPKPDAPYPDCGRVAAGESLGCELSACE